MLFSKTNIIILVLFFHSTLSQKIIDICHDGKDLTPRRPRNDINNENLKDVLTLKAKKNVERGSNTENFVGDKTPVLGSNDKVTNPWHDAGLLSTIVEAYDMHYNLRTSPDDWWYHIIQTVAVDLDKMAKSENEFIKNETRKFFVQHEGKKEITVKTGPSIYGIDYAWLFDQFSNGIKNNINKPEFVDEMAPDFSTTTSVQTIVANIVLMKSVEEFFSYTIFTACGIPKIEMKGTLEDWEKLPKKIQKLREVIKPLEQYGNLKTYYGYTSWWDRVINVANKLVDTFKGDPDTDWWSKIITKKSYGSGSPEFGGWFMTDVLNVESATSISDAPSGLVSVPMKVTDGSKSDNATVLAGLAGYKLHNDDGIFALEPVHGWCLLMPKDSSFRNDLVDWEEKINGVGSEK